MSMACKNPHTECDVIYSQRGTLARYPPKTWAAFCAI